MRERLLIGATGFSPIREELAYPFEPPLESVEEVSKRFAALRGEALRPAFDAAPAARFPGDVSAGRPLHDVAYLRLGCV